MDADGRSHTLPPWPPGSCSPGWARMPENIPFSPLPTRRRQSALRLRMSCLPGTLSSANTEGSGEDNRSGCEPSAGAPRGTDQERFSEAGGCASGPSRDLRQVQTHGVHDWAAALVADNGQLSDPGGPSHASSAAHGLSPSIRAFLSRWSVHRPLQNHTGEGGAVDRTAWAMVPPWKDLEGERVCPTCQQPLRGALSSEGTPLFYPDPLLLPTAEASASGVLCRPLHRQPCSEEVLGDGMAGLCEVPVEAERESLQQEAPLGPRPDQPKNRPLLLDDMLVLVALCLQDLKLREFMKQVGDFLDRNTPQNGEGLQQKRMLSPLLPSCVAATSCFLDRPGSPQPPPPPPNSPSFC
ncbi:E3 ubiquitin ligase TRIM40 isoform X1 [Mustela nigripes]|uniref:E3 ubiquitin ligase TRIM40 isoform X1 n=1 Tax=Mustela nigripes TaxID=77151 RepID=UPI002815F5E9|nr:E3 ubiquitin ligase TRIM40 isoform X1 [Mustela nigripes]